MLEGAKSNTVYEYLVMCFVIWVKQVNPERFYEERDRVQGKWRERADRLVSKFSRNSELPSYDQSTKRPDSLTLPKYERLRKHIASQAVENVARV